MSSLHMRKMRADGLDFDPSFSTHRIAAMRTQERRSYKRLSIPEQLSVQKQSKSVNSHGHDDSDPVDEECHRLMYDWCYTVADSFGASRETVYIGLSYCNRFLASEDGRPFCQSRFLYQLAAFTSLHIAIKVHHVKQFDLYQLVDISGQRYTLTQFAKTEKLILRALDWKMNPPTPFSFLREMMSLLPDNTDRRVASYILTLSTYQAEMAVLDQELMNQSASSLAVAFLLNAMAATSIKDLPYSSRAEVVAALRDLEFSGRDLGIRKTREALQTVVDECRSLWKRSSSKEKRASRPPLTKKESVGNLSPVCVSSSDLHQNPKETDHSAKRRSSASMGVGS